MKKLILLFSTIISIQIVHGQSIGIGANTTPDQSAILDVNGTTKGFLAPRMTNIQRGAIATPAVGLMVFQTNNGITAPISSAGMYINMATGWKRIATSDEITAGSSSWTVNGVNQYNALSGNIGIGTMTPVEKLSVFSNYGYGISHEANTIKLSTYIDAGGAYIGTISNHPFHFYTNNGLAQMTLNTNGNVGIANSFPAAKFDISHASLQNSPTLRLFENNNSDYARLRFQNSSGANFWDIAGLNSTTNTAERLNIFNSASGNIMSITGDGKVGIGTISPANKLDVNGNIFSTGNIMANSFNLNTPKTYNYSLSGADFVEVNSGNTIQREGISGGGISMSGSSSTSGFVASVHLPDAAIVTRLTVYFKDISAGINLEVFLQMSDLISQMANITSSGAMGDIFLSDDTILSPTISNNKAYVVYARPAGGQWPTSDIILRRVIIEYLISGL